MSSKRKLKFDFNEPDKLREKEKTGLDLYLDESSNELERLKQQYKEQLKDDEDDISDKKAKFSRVKGLFKS